MMFSIFPPIFHTIYVSAEVKLKDYGKSIAS